MYALQSIGAIVIGFFIDFIVILYAGTVFQSMWVWFIVPTFDVTGLSFMMATGLVIVASFLVMRTPVVDAEQSIEEILKEGLYKAFLKGLRISFFWLLAWVVVTVL